MTPAAAGATINLMDTKETIEEAARAGLDAFHALMAERREAGYNRGARMREWVVGDSVWLDTCGNCWIITQDSARPRFDLVWAQTDQVKGEHLEGAMGRLPTSADRCSHCGEGWSLRKAGDLRGVRTTRGHDDPVEFWHPECLRDHRLNTKADALRELGLKPTVVTRANRVVAEALGWRIQSTHNCYWSANALGAGLTPAQASALDALPEVPRGGYSGYRGCLGDTVRHDGHAGGKAPDGDSGSHYHIDTDLALAAFLTFIKVRGTTAP